MKNKYIQLQNNENHEIRIIPLQNCENHANSNISHQNHATNHEIYGILHKNQETKK